MKQQTALERKRKYRVIKGNLLTQIEAHHCVSFQKDDSEWTKFSLWEFHLIVYFSSNFEASNKDASPVREF